MVKNLKSKFIFALLSLSTLEIANAASTQATMQVTTTVLPVCSVTTSNVTFNSFLPNNGTNQRKTMIAKVKCTKGATADITLSGGQNLASDGGFGAPERRMINTTNPSAYLTYQVFDMYSQLVSPSSPFTVIYGEGTDVEVDVWIDFDLEQNQPTPGGTYVDTLTLTITY